MWFFASPPPSPRRCISLTFDDRRNRFGCAEGKHFWERSFPSLIYSLYSKCVASKFHQPLDLISVTWSPIYWNKPKQKKKTKLVGQYDSLAKRDPTGRPFTLLQFQKQNKNSTIILSNRLNESLVGPIHFHVGTIHCTLDTEQLKTDIPDPAFVSSFTHVSLLFSAVTTQFSFWFTTSFPLCGKVLYSS